MLVKRGNKKAVSIIVAYVLLVVIAISLSGLVYNWLRFQVTPSDVEKCPEGVTLIIKELTCSGDEISILLENKGTFSIDGFIIRINNRSDAEFGVYTLGPGEILVREGGLKPGDTYPLDPDSGETLSFGLGDFGGTPALLDVQPFVYAENGQKTYCARVSSNDLDCV